MIRSFVPVAIAFLLLVPDTHKHAVGQDDKGAESETDLSDDREKLRTLRESLVNAILAGDVDGQLQRAHENIVTTWQNNQTANRHDGLRKFFKENLSNQELFQGYTERPSSDVVDIYPNASFAVAQGKSVPHYRYMGQEFDLENRWTATLIKQGDDWKLVSYHVSGNIGDNPLLNVAKRSLYWGAGLAFVIGLAIGALGLKLIKK